MAVDIIARMMAMGNGGGSGDSYTKAETDQLLDGKADLVDGKVPASELPSYVDDTVEGYYYQGAFYEDSEHTITITGETGKIYIDLTTNKSYRWTGTVYVRIDECPAFGETQGTIYEGNKGKANADEIAAIKDGTNIDSFADVETALADKADKSTTYTKGQVDAALATKLNTADVDASLSSTSTNPVQNKAVQAPIARLVDAGAKNLLKITATSTTVGGVTFTVADGIVTATGTSGNNGASLALATYTPAEAYKLILTGTPVNDVRAWLDYLSTDLTDLIQVSGGQAKKLWSTKTGWIRIGIPQNTHVEGLVFKPMICTVEDYNISTEFVPYTPSNSELYEMILALQNAQNGG